MCGRPLTRRRERSARRGREHDGGGTASGATGSREPCHTVPQAVTWGSGRDECPMDTREQDVPQRWFALFIVLAIAVNGSGLGLPILGPDAAVYASIAKTMVQQHNWP